LESAPPTLPPDVAVADVGKALPATLRERQERWGGGVLPLLTTIKKPGLLKNVSSYSPVNANKKQKVSQKYILETQIA
jgi:hypothetical protein